MNKRPTIAIVAHDVGGTGGMERHLEELITRLKVDADVIVVSCTLRLKNMTGIRFVHIPIPTRPASLKIVLFLVLASIRILFLKFDILHTTGAIVLNRADLSTVHFCHVGYMEATGGSRIKNSPSLLHRVNQWLSATVSMLLERLIYRPTRTRQLVAVSNRVKREIMSHFPYRPTDVHTIPNGVDIERFVPRTESEKKLLRRDKGLPEEGLYVLFMGGDWGLKGLEFVLRALSDVSDWVPKLHLVVVGNGNKERYEKFVSENFRESVYFVGRQSDPHAWFGLSDVFAFPSSYEAFSLVVHEAAASGLIVLSTQVGGVEDLIVDTVNGIFIDRDIVAISEKVCALAARLEQHREMGRRARSSVERLTWGNMYNEFHAIYLGIVRLDASRDRRWQQYERVDTSEKRHSGIS